MSTVTDDDFESLADGELGWRRLELHALAKELEKAASAHGSGPTVRALTRGMSTLLYAHWEGYCKAVFTAYLKLILRRRPLVSEAADRLILAHTQQIVRRIDSGDTDALGELVAIVRGTSTQRLRISQDKIVDTKSNLRFQVLEDITSALGIPLTDLITKKNLIDVQLCDTRNEIAHGRASFPSPQETLDLHRNVVAMMEDIRDVTIGQVRLKGYRINIGPQA
ncbi:MAE_28990/MAE_18760 family HEPN-like nuclease [Mycolicibacter heraklionensis]|uniref:MAE_28990/MAE_18760 family HEPN-like nuclease n=1 Tax=Mycolicibacter heraklionensis TaxID=512402 RepID=UPI000AB7DDCE|nr:MAE_28990/MAE_18760 family HEPN-like nuclease [Mycolicibacter heraklionensis]